LDCGFESYGACEQTARRVHSETGITAPVDALELATACGLALQPKRGKAKLRGEVIYFDPTARAVRQQGQIAHETAHYLLRLHAIEDSERAVGYMAGALMLPQAAYARDIDRTAWDLEQLAKLHPNASGQMLAMRIGDLREAVVTVLDQGQVTTRIASPWLPPAPERMARVERELADKALASGTVQRANDLLAAYPLIDGPHRRVIVVAELRQLSFRLDQTD
jgi:hypothetical protein